MIANVKSGELLDCTACGAPSFHEVCISCVAARARAAATGRCACPKRMRRPKLVDLGFRAHYSCERCLGVIAAMTAKGSKER